jgi:hypothetical protein
LEFFDAYVLQSSGFSLNNPVHCKVKWKEKSTTVSAKDHGLYKVKHKSTPNKACLNLDLKLEPQYKQKHQLRNSSDRAKEA